MTQKEIEILLEELEDAKEDIYCKEERISTLEECTERLYKENHEIRRSLYGNMSKKTS